MLAISWRKWSDLIVDYGQQLYVPWLLSEGQVLYRDIHYIYGPLSSYLHALLFKIFGPGIIVLAWFNIVLIAGLAWILYLVLKDITDELTATAGTLTFITVFAFAQYVGGGNFNFVGAYVYELPHGIFLSFLAIQQFAKYARNPEPRRLAILGFLCGLIYLTKPEVFLAAFTALVMGLAMVHRWANPQQPFKKLLVFASFYLILSLGFLVYFSLHTSVGTGLETLISPWVHIMNSELRSLPLYQWMLGTRDFGSNLIQAVIYFFFISGLLVLIFLVNRVFKSFIESQRLATGLFGLLLTGLILLLSGQIHLLSLGRPLPVILFIFAGYLFYKIFNDSQAKTPRPEIWVETVLTVFSFLLLLKILFNTHIYHYGFALALPATLITVKIFLYDFPRWGRHFGANLSFCRSLSLILVLIFISVHFKLNSNIYQLKGLSVGTQRDRIVDYHSFLDSRGLIFNAALDYIDQNFDKGIEFATLPDTIMVNYLSRHKSSTEYIILNPGVWLLVGNEAVIDSLKRSSPLYILLVDREYPEFGLKIFGKDFGAGILDWVMKNYLLEKQFGKTPFTGQGFGIQILKQKETQEYVNE